MSKTYTISYYALCPHNTGTQSGQIIPWNSREIENKLEAMTEYQMIEQKHGHNGNVCVTMTKIETTDVTALFRED